jgi:hypothetical protein
MLKVFFGTVFILIAVPTAVDLWQKGTQSMPFQLWREIIRRKKSTD